MSETEEIPEVRVHWDVTLWGPRAADNQHHIVGGSGPTPEAAIAALRRNIRARDDLIARFLDTAARLTGSG